MIRRLRCRPPYERWDCSCCGKSQDRPPVSTTAGLACEACLDRGRRGEPFIPLTVRMVQPAHRPEDRPVLAVCMREHRCLTETGEIFDLPGLVERVRERHPGETGRGRKLIDRLPAGWVITDNALDLLAYLENSPAAESELWQWQCALRSPSAWRPEAGVQVRRAFTYTTPKPVRFGYPSRKHGGRRSKGRAYWHQLIDVHAFCELPDGWGQTDTVELLRFGLDLRGWANRNHLPMLPSASSYGARLLRDARFGGGWRRKVPAATNEAIRRRLPGNHYQLMTTPGRSLRRVHKLDQHAAHHYAALHGRFPHPDQLRAHGWFRQPPPNDGDRVKGDGAIMTLTGRWRELIAQPGMFTIAVYTPEQLAIDSLQIPALRKPGWRWRSITSVEVEHLKRTPGVILGDIWAAWTSPDTDERLNELAYWAGRQLTADNVSPMMRRWLKPTLLAAYGMLAARARRFRGVFRWANAPDGAVGFPTRYGQLIGYERSTKRERESRTVNVLWRALIESSVRLESLTFAQQLRTNGFRPVSIYADAVFATGTGTPPSPVPWRYEGIIHDLIFESPGRYRSREEVRLPGVPKLRSGRLQPALPTAKG